MKKIVFLMVLAIGMVATSNAQVRGVYGTLQTYTTFTGSLYNNSLTAVAADTLKGVDTSYIYFSFATPLKLQFTLQTIQKADSLSGTAVLQAWAGSNSGWVTRTGYWNTYTGDTSRCTTCVGAIKTFTLATGTQKATWVASESGQPSTFSNWRIRIIGTRSTDTTAVTATAYYSY
jgi:hypothetical protein